MKILSLFTATKEEKEAKAAKRVGRALLRGQESLIDSLEARKDKAQDTIDKLTGGSVDKINTETFNEVYHKAKLELLLLEQEIKIANEVKSDLYTEA